MFVLKLMSAPEETLSGVRLSAVWAFTANYRFERAGSLHGGPLSRLLHIETGLYVGPSLRSQVEALVVIDHLESLPIDWFAPFAELTAACHRNTQDWKALMKRLRTPTAPPVNAVDWLLQTPEWAGAEIKETVVRTIQRPVKVARAFRRSQFDIRWMPTEAECVVIVHPSGARAVVPKDATSEMFIRKLPANSAP